MTFRIRNAAVVIAALALLAAGCSKDVEILPRVKITEPVNPVSANVVFAYLLQERNSRDADIVAEYSLNWSETYVTATQGPGGDPTENLSTSTSGIPHSFVWDTLADLGNSSVGQVYFRITPYRDAKEGHSDEAGPLRVRNFEFSILSAPTLLDNAGSVQSHPSCAFDCAGTLYAVWADERDCASRIYFADSFGVPVNFSAGASAAAEGNLSILQTTPAVAADNAGHVYAAWVREQDGSKSVYFAYSYASGSPFNAAFLVDTPNVGEEQYQPDVIVDRREHQVFVAWVSEKAGNADVFLNRSGDGGETFEGVQTVVNAVGNQLRPRMAVGRGDRVLVTWEDYRNGNPRVWLGRSIYDGASFISEQASDPPANASQLEPVTVESGNAYAFVAWVEQDGNESGIYLTRSLAYDFVFEDPVLISSNASIAGPPSIVADGTGFVYLAWSETDGNVTTIRMAHFEDNADWPLDVGLLAVTDVATPALSAPNPALFLDSRGAPVIFWQDGSAIDPKLYYSFGE